MRKTYIVLPDGTEISSGQGAVHAVQSCSFTECVNTGTELTPGAVCAAMVELALITPDLHIAAGDELTIYQQWDGVREKLGIFIAEKPTRPSAHTMKLTAYDRVCRLDKDLTSWLAALTGWPYSLYTLAVMVCNACGVTLKNTAIPNGSHLVQAFSASGITGRRLLQWIGQAAGCFCRADAEGALEFAWYAPVKQAIAPTGAQVSCREGVLTVCDPALTATAQADAVALTGVSATVADSTLAITTDATHFYYQGGLTFADYTVAPIEKVQLGSTEEDVGTVYPDISGGNTCRITGNPLLTADTAQTLVPVAETLFSRLSGAVYTPCTVTIAATPHIRAGHILPIVTPDGKVITAYVMTKKQSGGRDTLECTGSHRRDSVSAVNEQSYTALSGKVLQLRTDVDGLLVENKAADGRAASLQLTVEGLQTQVQRQSADADALRTALTAVQQSADALSVRIRSMDENGVSKVRTDTDYTFDSQGLTIARSGQQMENRLDNTGMYVSRAGQVILQANSDGVTAVDVSVGNYLRLGNNARLEDYESGRTACFYTGG